MLDAIRVAYPPQRSAAGYILGPVIDPRTYVRALHLFAMFPIGIAYFVTIVVLLSVGGSLAWTLLGPPILIAQLYLSR